MSPFPFKLELELMPFENDRQRLVGGRLKKNQQFLTPYQYLLLANA